MSAAAVRDRPPLNRPSIRAAGMLALLAYLPALTAAPGRMPADSKLYLYLDPARFLGDAASSFDSRQFAGWVPHQHVAYLWPTGPWFWLFDVLHVPDWVAHRLWIGTLMVVAGLGVRWCARLLGLGQLAALVAAVVYQLSPYVLPYVSRTSVMLLPWAGLGWIVAFTVRAGRRRTWGDPAAVALIVFTVGAVNATALAMIVPAPVLWLLHAAWQRSLAWRSALVVALRVAALTLPLCAWWIAMLVIQGRHGADVLPYSESLADVSLTATGPEVWRSLGYWLFYVRDPYAATTTESLRYLSSTPSIFVSYAVPIACLAGLVLVRWSHRRFAALLVGAGALLAVGVHPIEDRSPLMQLIAGDDERGLALALRSSTRALPVMNLGLALLAGALVAAAGTWRLPRLGLRPDRIAAALIAVLAVVNLPSLWNGAFVDPALERDQDPPAAWEAAAAALDASGVEGRVLQVPGAEFGAFRWGYTVDQPLPGLTDKPLVTRDLLPLGSPGAMDLLYALDDRIQDGVFEPGSLAAVARWLGVDTVWVTNDLADDRFRTARPEVLGAEIATASDVGPVTHFGPIGIDHPVVAMTDERALGDPRATAPNTPVDLYPIEPPGTIVRASGRTVVVSGSGDGLVDLAAAGVLDGSELVRYSASLSGAELAAAIDAASGLLVTDSNRDRARHWRSSQDATGYTESDQPELELLRDVASDRRLPVFPPRDAAVDPTTQTVARQVGAVTATATSYGEPFAYLPEHRPVMAIDGDPDTAWIVGEHGDPIGETLRLHFDRPPASIGLLQPAAAGQRRITTIAVSDADDPASSRQVALADPAGVPDGHLIELPAGATTIDLTIVAVAGGDPATAGAAAGVGFAEVVTGLDPTIEIVRPPHDALAALPPTTPLTLAFTRLRTDPMDRWREDPEPMLVRGFDLASDRQFTAVLDVGVDARAGDEQLAALFGWPAWTSSRLTGSLLSAGVSAIDGDPGTTWITAFGGARGATLVIDGVTEPVDRISVRQPVGVYSKVTAVSIRSGGEERTIELVPDAAGTASAELDPPLAPGRVEIEITAIEPATTVDRRFGDPAELPAAISEIELPGLPTAVPVAESATSLECVPLLSVDGVELRFSLELAGAEIAEGSPASAEPCDRPPSLAAGERMIAAIDPGIPVHVDRVVLSDPGSSDSAASAVDDGERPVAKVVERGRFERTIEVTGCRRGCWLVLGEGHSTAWEATGPDGSLGEPQLVDGGFNGWRLEPSEGAITVAVEWAPQRRLHLAFALSAIGVALALALLVIDRIRNTQAMSEGEDERPAPATGDERTSRRHAIALGAAWCVLAAVLIGPVWAVWGAAGGIAVVLSRRGRLAASTALATLIVVGAVVTVREYRNAPAPNGNWPATFDSLHELAMFAIVSVIVAALFADDSSGFADGYAGGRAPKRERRRRAR